MNKKQSVGELKFSMNDSLKAINLIIKDEIEKALNTQHLVPESDANSFPSFKSEMLKMMKEIDTKVTKPQKPQWVQDAIEEGKLEKDGKTLRVSVEEMAYWLFTHGVEGVDTDFMIKKFRLKIKYSTAQQAVSRGKP